MSLRAGLLLFPFGFIPSLFPLCCPCDKRQVFVPIQYVGGDWQNLPATSSILPVTSLPRLRVGHDTGTNLEAWCLRIHADASCHLSLSRHVVDNAF